MRQQIGSGYVEGVAVIPPISNIYDAAVDSSNKVFTVPGNEMWKICNAHVVLATTATVGNRQMAFEVKDAAGQVITNLRAGAVQAASTTYHYTYMQGIYRETTFTANEIQCPIQADLYVPPGGTIRFLDETAVAAAADDMTVSMQIMRFNV